MAEIKSEITNSYNCPICKVKLLPPIYQCHKGHFLCSKCEAGFKFCPTCGDALPKKKQIQNGMLEEIIQGLTIECENVRQGCLETFKGSEREDHLWDCLYSKLPICTHLGLNCDSQQSLVSILDHCRSAEHELQGYNFEECSTDSQNVESSFIEIGQSMSPGKFEGSKKYTPEWKPLYFTFKNRIFFLTTKYSKKEDSIKWTASILGSKKGSNEFLARIKFIPNKTEFQDTFLECQRSVTDLKSQGSGSSHEDTKRNQKSKSKYLTTFEISLQNLKEFCAPHSKNETQDEKLDTGDATKQDPENESEEMQWKIQLSFLPRNSNKNSAAAKKPAEILKTDVIYADDSQKYTQKAKGNGKSAANQNTKEKQNPKGKENSKEGNNATKNSKPQNTKEAKNTSENKSSKETKKSSGAKNPKETKNAKEAKEAKKPKETKNAKEAKEAKMPKETKKAKEAKEAKNPADSNELPKNVTISFKVEA